MAKWLQSGLRRDVCYVCAAADRPTESEIKRAIEARYDERVSPGTFRGALSALVDAGHVATAPDGLHDRYWLTEAGRGALEAHREWVCRDR